jgi:hypothetical protein
MGTRRAAPWPGLPPATRPLFPVVGMTKPTLHRDLPRSGSGLSVIEAASDAAREITMLTGSLIQNKEKKVI